MPHASYTLILGTKRYSSWSLRPWVLMRHCGIAFDEIVIRLRQPETKAQILAHVPSGKVPALLWGENVISDSLAICETIADLHPDAGLLPADPVARAYARSVSAEMHSGFADLRRDMPMDCLKRHPGEGHSEAALADARRVVSLWGQMRARFGERAQPDEGFLFGRFSIADAMFMPVCTRFETYDVDLRKLGDEDGRAGAYCRHMLNLPAYRDWVASAAPTT